MWQGEPVDEARTYTYMELYTEVNKFANVLKKKGVKKGDRVSIYLPMIPELPIAMLACARIGAIHSIVFGGFQCRRPERQNSGLRSKSAHHQRCFLPERKVGPPEG